MKSLVPKEPPLVKFAKKNDFYLQKREVDGRDGPEWAEGTKPFSE